MERRKSMDKKDWAGIAGACDDGAGRNPAKKAQLPQGERDSAGRSLCKAADWPMQ